MTDSVAAGGRITIASDRAGLIDLLAIRDDAVASRRVLKAPGFVVVRLTFAGGQELAEHEAAVPILIQVLSGAVDIEVDGAAERFEAGGVLYLAPHVRHALRAIGRADVLLTLADASTRVSPDGAGVGGNDVIGFPSAIAETNPATLDGDGAIRAHAPSPEDRRLLDAAVCECGVVAGAALPQFDVREVPHAVRHAAVFGALDSLGPREGLVLIAPHDPLPLLAQIRERTGERFAVTYLERGPEAWSLQFIHLGDDAAR
ncbi:DUF2249 domain-containing protein [Humibacter sp. RRB41]|uniref:DUF2249 domain-containing protein n=1 Tax=Humibacter sp. RRB41 TaxID=2919946 RepID=UPI001FAAC8F0|nr:DUF2249 domain-containing protein [Humibacter sp. RRB41]